MVVWGTGAPRREFLHVDDLADASLYLMEHFSEATTINVGVGKDVTIKELVAIICDVVGFEGELEFDTSRPDGTPQKMLNIARLRSIGWTPNVELRDGLATTYAWFWKILTNCVRPNNDITSFQFDEAAPDPSGGLCQGDKKSGACGDRLVVQTRRQDICRDAIDYSMASE